MTYSGHIENGTIILNDGPALPNGAKVIVTLVNEQSPSGSRLERPLLYERMKAIFGIANDLPEDGSLNLEHYLYDSRQE